MNKLREWIKGFTSDLNQPAFKALVAALLTLATGVSYLITMQVRVWTGYCPLGESTTVYVICRGDLQEEAWWAWLTFLAALWGVTFLDYRTKRNTSAKGRPPDDELDGPLASLGIGGKLGELDHGEQPRTPPGEQGG